MWVDKSEHQRRYRETNCCHLRDSKPKPTCDSLLHSLDSFPLLDVVRVNLLGVMHGSKVALERMAPAGVVINIASLAGVMLLPQAPAYSATKAAVIHYTRLQEPLYRISWLGDFLTLSKTNLRLKSIGKRGKMAKRNLKIVYLRLSFNAKFLKGDEEKRSELIIKYEFYITVY